MRSLAISMVRSYQRLVSPLFPRRCRYYPTCSEYTVQSIQMFGVSRGCVLATWRLLRCNPWSKGGVDHPADQTLFGAR